MSSSLLSLCFSFFLLFSTVTSLNITKLLSDFSDFSKFNDLLIKTQVASTINSRQTITVLAIDNDNISPLSSQSLDMQKKILSMHVILDYYDDSKLQKLPNKTELLTTLYQSSGQAKDQEGFLNVTLMNGEVVLGSGVPGSSLDSKLVKAVVTQPYNVSILQISSVIMPSTSNSTSPSSSPASSPNSTSPSPSPSLAPAPSTAAPPKSGQAPSSFNNASSPTPASESPQASTPADAPGGDSPMSSPPAMGPSGDAPEADAPAADTPKAAGASNIGGSGARVFMGVMVLFSVLGL